MVAKETAAAMTADCPRCRGLRNERSLDDADKFDRIAARLDKALAAKALVPDPDQPWDTSVTPFSYARLRRDLAENR